MNDSGIEWIGDIPEYWKPISIKRITVISYGFGQPPIIQEVGIPIIRATNISKGKILKEDLIFTSLNNFSQEKIPLLKQNEILVVRSGAYTGDSAIITKEYEGSLPGYDLRITPCDIHSPYLAWCLLSEFVKNQINDLKLRAAQPHINSDDLGSCIICLPKKIETQKEIADFLDKKTFKIDSDIQKNKKLIELLKEKRQTIINQAVTKGLDPTVPMKNSGLDWIGIIPKHWNINKLKYLTSCLDGKRIPLNSEERGDRKGPYPYYGASGLVDYIDEYIFDEKLVCLAEDGENLHSRALPISFIIEGKTWVNNHAHVLRPNNVNAEYLTYLLNSMNVMPYLEGATRMKLNQDKMNDFVLPYPTIYEQKQIAEFLDEYTSKIDSLIQNAESQIEKLQEYSKVIISEAVTGKIDVREEVVA